MVRLRENLQEASPGTELIGKSPAMKKVVELIEMVAPTEATVLITGESGTGKEVVARAIHAASPRRYMPMVTIHCGALTETLLESELFGHEKGAFTGRAVPQEGQVRSGRRRHRSSWTKSATSACETQTDLLRVLQEKEIVRVGGNQQIKVDFRCIAATNKNLETLVKAGTFRPDLYYRLHVFCIDLPPLRDRREDIPLLVNHFLNKFCMATSRPVPQLSPEALETADAPRLAGQRARTGKRRGARAGGGARHRNPPVGFFLPVSGRRAARAARRWKTSSARTSSAFCGRPSTTSRARRGFWISTAPLSTTSCAVTDCGETDSSHPARAVNGSGPGVSGSPRLSDLEYLAAALARTFRTPCQIRPETLDVWFRLGPAARSSITPRPSSSGWSGWPIRTRVCWASPRATSSCRC